VINNFCDNFFFFLILPKIEGVLKGQTHLDLASSSRFSHLEQSSENSSNKSKKLITKAERRTTNLAKVNHLSRSIGT
jgi:hypothetical protein